MKNQVLERSLLTFPVTTSLESLVKGYLLNCKCENKSATTIATYERCLGCFLWFCRVNDYPDQPQQISTLHVRAFLSYLGEANRWGGKAISARAPARQSTINKFYRVLNTFFGWLKREELIPDNPVAHLKTPKIGERVVQALSPNEIDRLLSSCNRKTYLDCRNRAIVMMLLDSGMRVSELASLNLEDVDTTTGSIIIRRGKGGKERVVRIGSNAQKSLWRYLVLFRGDASGKLFLNRSGDALSVTGLKLMIRRLGAQSGVRGVHVHRLRHTFAISFLRAGGDIFSLKYLLGHTSLSMVSHYLASLSAEDASRAHKKFSPMDLFRVGDRV